MRRQRQSAHRRGAFIPYGQKTETAEKTVNFLGQYAGARDGPVHFEGGQWPSWTVVAGGRYGLGADPGLRHGDGGPRAAGAQRISGRRKPHPEGPTEGSTEALGRRASHTRRDWPWPRPQGSRRGRNGGAARHHPGLVPQACRPQVRWLESPSRPRQTADRARFVRMAEENRSWGYDRIAGALTNLGQFFLAIRGPRNCVELFGQPRFAQALKVVLVIVGVFECCEPSRNTAYCVVGLETHQLSDRRPGLLKPAHLSIGRGQPDMTVAEIR